MVAPFIELPHIIVMGAVSATRQIPRWKTAPAPPAEHLQLGVGEVIPYFPPMAVRLLRLEVGGPRMERRGRDPLGVMEAAAWEAIAPPPGYA
ncbi:MAG: hypothetical protein L0Y50_07950 [Beijerinckiaceae bacterium]|nr:hypothetical protein [Beijerinckiaceae bacterium]MCI0736189.1 hypothetical protein [Beijerinckiaceae bacterium]